MYIYIYNPPSYRFSSFCCSHRKPYLSFAVTQVVRSHPQNPFAVNCLFQISHFHQYLLIELTLHCLLASVAITYNKGESMYVRMATFTYTMHTLLLSVLGKGNAEQSCRRITASFTRKVSTLTSAVMLAPPATSIKFLHVWILKTRFQNKTTLLFKNTLSEL